MRNNWFYEGCHRLISERVIEFPIPDWNRPLSKIPEGAFCICYQSEFDESGYGPYGFNTAKAEKLVDRLINSAYFFGSKSLELSLVKKYYGNGLYVFNVGDELKEHVAQSEKFLKRSRLLERYGKNACEESDRPALLKMLMSGELILESSNVNILEHVFLRTYYAPEAGPSFVFFDKDIKRQIKNISEAIGVNYKTVSSFESLKAW